VASGGFDAPLIRVLVDAFHPGFEGHFPGDPLLPGVVQIGFVVDALASRFGATPLISAIPALRFRRVVRPGDELEILLSEPDAQATVRFEVRCAGELVSDGRLVVARPA
jgi:3-hydroxymyristoyl/3-hydroxydecanoyl-(acyl carrier protein) dehydratase